MAQPISFSSYNQDTWSALPSSLSWMHLQYAHCFVCEKLGMDPHVAVDVQGEDLFSACLYSCNKFNEIRSRQFSRWKVASASSDGYWQYSAGAPQWGPSSVYQCFVHGEFWDSCRLRPSPVCLCQNSFTHKSDYDTISALFQMITEQWLPVHVVESTRHSPPALVWA